MKVHVPGPLSHHFDITRTEQRQCFEDIWEVVHEKEKQEWAYHGALRDITAHWNGPRVLSTDLHPRDPSRKIYFIPPYDDITKTEGLRLRQKNSLIDGVKGLGKIETWGVLKTHCTQPQFFVSRLNGHPFMAKRRQRLDHKLRDMHKHAGGILKLAELLR